MSRLKTAIHSVQRLSLVSASAALAAVFVAVAAAATLLSIAGAGGTGVSALLRLAGTAPWTTTAVALPIVALSLGTAVLIASRERKRAAIVARDAELARMSWRLDFALGASQVGVWDVDLETNQLRWDERARALFGAPHDKKVFCDADWVAVLHPEDRDRAVAEAEAAVAGDGRFVSDYRVLLPDGRVRHIRDMAASYRGDDGARRLVGLVWDMSADVERQEELELRRREAEAATLAKSQFLAAMSHEIRTPMTGVLGMLDLLLDGSLSDPQRERVRIAHASALSLLQILNDILDFSKLEAQQVRLREESVPLRQLVREMLEPLAAGAEQKGLRLTHEVAETVPEWIVTDPLRLRQILTNLVSNATKFTEAGQVRVSIEYSTGSLHFCVEDTGIGISPELCDQIFERFVQADTSLSRRAGGTGLGLAISKQLVEIMGGEISVRSTLGIGSTFSFSVAVTAGIAPAAGPATVDAALASPDLRPLNVLLAEDNATNRYLIEAYLQATGHVVTTVSNGAEAVAAVADGSFDLVLMDVQMPEMDGPSAARAIRLLPGRPARIPIVALTANALPGDRESYFAAGMTDYVSKPIDFPALRRALVRAVAANRGTAAAEQPSSPLPAEQRAG